MLLDAQTSGGLLIAIFLIGLFLEYVMPASVVPGSVATIRTISSLPLGIVVTAGALLKEARPRTGSKIERCAAL